MKRKDSAVSTIIILLFFGLLTCAGTLLVFHVYPVSTLTCQHTGPGQVDCQLQERVVGLLPIRETSIEHLKEAYVVRETAGAFLREGGVARRGLHVVREIPPAPVHRLPGRSQTLPIREDE